MPETIKPRVPELNRHKLLPINLDRRQSANLQQQLSLEIRRCIQDGIVIAGDFLPSSRELSRDLRVSRNTVIAAYDRLLGEGYLEAAPKRGIFVKEEIDRTKLKASLRNAGTSHASVPLKTADSQFRTPLPFRPCQPDVGLFPLSQWNRMRNRALQKWGPGLLHYQSRFALGVPSLRYSIAEYLRKSRGVRCSWEQVVVTGGSQHALFLLAKLLVKPGDRVLLEDPGYPGARFAMQQSGAVIKTMAVDEEGVLPTICPKGTKILYVTPSRQFPTGACLPVARRLEILRMVAETHAWLIEDDYDSEFRYSRPPLPSLSSLDEAGRVIYMGSMSKVLFPSLRIGYLVLPKELLESFEALRWIVDDHGPLIDQATLAEFISSGAFFSHIRRCRKTYAAKLEVFLNAAAKHALPLSFPFTDGGMNLTGYFEDRRVDAEEASRALEEEGLDVPPLSKFALRTPRPGLVFGFTAFDHETIQQSIAKVAKVLRRIQSSRSSTKSSH